MRTFTLLSFTALVLAGCAANPDSAPSGSPVTVTETTTDQLIVGDDYTEPVATSGNLADIDWDREPSEIDEIARPGIAENACNALVAQQYIEGQKPITIDFEDTDSYEGWFIVTGSSEGSTEHAATMEFECVHRDGYTELVVFEQAR